MFGSLFGKKDEPKPRHPGLPSPLSLRLGAAVRLDSILSRVLSAEGYVFELPDAGHVLSVASQGVVDLGEGVRLHRFYFEDDWWLQVKVSGAAGTDPDAGVDEMHLFGFGDVLTPSSQAEFDQMAARIGLPTYSYAEKDYARVWGQGAGAVATSDFDERVYPASDASYGVRHQDMLYSRPVPGSPRPELLLVSTETTDSDEVTVVHSVGIPLDPSDLEIT